MCTNTSTSLKFWLSFWASSEGNSDSVLTHGKGSGALMDVSSFFFLLRFFFLDLRFPAPLFADIGNELPGGSEKLT